MSTLQRIVCTHSVCVQLSIYLRQKFNVRPFRKNMENTHLRPPIDVRGMTDLRKDAFKKQVRIPTLRVSENLLDKVRPHLKNLLLKMEHLKPIRSATPRNGKSDSETDKEILLHPKTVTGWESLPNELISMGVSETDFYFCDLSLTYENWKADEILKSVLPPDQEGMSSYSKIGHIIHINLRDHLEPYKMLIGEVLMDKTVACRTVINKTNNIDNKYRNFELELICGEPDYMVEVKENGVSFKFDFSRVYWNPRLSTEHERIVNLLTPSDILYDVFAGVGPFSIPAACKKKCTVLANDLNPESYKWLNVNAKKNKCEARVRTFNKDGRDFIREDIRADMLERWVNSKESVNEMHIVMNLPAMAVEFLDVFDGLLSSENASLFENIHLPMVHVYTFVKAVENKEKLAVEAVEVNLKSKLSDKLHGVHFVRNVAPNKDMFRISFKLWEEVLFNGSRKRPNVPNMDEVNNKRICT